MNLLRRAALGASFALLVLVGVAGTSAASPYLGPRGWAPGALDLGLSSAGITTILWAAYLLGGGAVLLGLRRAPGPAASWRAVGLLAVIALCTSPFGSADHTNYAAYGRIAAQGGDPYAVPPVSWHGGHDPVTSAVEAPWTHTPSIYGPLATLLQLVTSLVGRANLRETVWAWQVVVVVAWLGVRILLRRLVEQLGPDDASAGPAARLARVDTLWTFNPAVFGVLVLGAHVDVVAVAFVLAALVVAPRHRLLPGLAVGAALSTKVTYGLVGLAVAYAWYHARTRPLRRDVGLLILGALLVAVPLHVWAGRHAFGQLAHAGGSSSLATAWSLLVQLLRHVLPEWAVTSVVLPLALVVAVALVWVLASLVRVGAGTVQAPGAGADAAVVTARAVGATFVLGTAYVLAAPYALPWYDAITWTTLPLVGASLIDQALLLRYVVLALAYVPGRVLGMSAQVESFTLGFRRSVAPWATLAVWLALAVCWHRARVGRGGGQASRRDPKRRAGSST